MEISQTNLIGSMVPDVYIKNITLESGGYTPKVSEPHIKHPYENTSDFSSSSQSMKVGLNLVMKDTLDNGLVGSWFSHKDFKKYLKLSVVQSTDPLVTKLLSSANNGLTLFSLDSGLMALAWIGELAKQMEKMPDGQESPFAGPDATAELYQYLVDNSSDKHYNLSDIVKMESSLSQGFEVNHEAGGKYYEVTHYVSFDVPTDKPEHLAYFAVTSIDLQEIKNDFGVHIDNMILADAIGGKLATDIVFNNNKLVNKSKIYTTQDGAIWSGGVVFKDGAWLSSTGDPLTSQVVNNNKLQDFRIAAQIDKISFDFADLENELFAMPSNHWSPLTSKQLIPPTDGVYFTKPLLTIDDEHRAKFIFGIDYNKIVKERSRYGKSMYGSGLAKFKDAIFIRSVTIKRQRVVNNHHGSNYLGSNMPTGELFDKENQAPEILVREMFNKKDTLSAFNSYGSFKELKIANTPFLMFEVVDKTMPTTTDGWYQYGVEIEIEDRTNQKIKDIIKGLMTTKSNFDAYATKALDSRFYNFKTNRFNEKFITEMNLWTEQSGAKIWENVVNHYKMTFDVFRNTSIKQSVIEKLHQMIAPETGNPRGVLMMQGLVDKLISKITDLAGTKLEVNSAAGGTSAASMSNKPAQTIKVEHFFKEVHDSNFPKNVGYDYLSPGGKKSEPTQEGIKEISWKDYTARCDLETKKYFKDTATTLEIIGSDETVYNPGDTVDFAKWTYLTPSNIDLGKAGGTCCLVEPFNIKANNNASTAIMAMNLSKQSPFAPMKSFFLDPDPPQQKKMPPKNGTASMNIKSNLASILAKSSTVPIQPKPTENSNPLLTISNIINFATQDPYVDASDLMEAQWDQIDALTASPIDTESSKVKLGAGQVDPSALMMYLTTPFLLGVGMNTSGPGEPTSTINGAQMAKKMKSYSKSWYTLGSKSNAIEDLIKKYGNDSSLPNGLKGGSAQSVNSQSGLGSGQGGSASMPTYPWLSVKVKQLPNQVKSLLLGDKPFVKQNWMPQDNSQMDLFQLPEFLPSVAINYKMLTQTEVLTGYGKDSFGKPMPKAEVWKPLTENLKQQLKGKVVCRLKKYENLDFGIEHPKALSLPVYNAYFVMSFPQTVVPFGIGSEISPTVEAIKNNGKQGQEIPTEYIQSNQAQDVNIKITAKAMVKWGMKL